MAILSDLNPWKARKDTELEVLHRPMNGATNEEGHEGL